MDETKAKRVVITGVTRGLGLAMAREFARLGHTIFGCGRSAEQLADLWSMLGPPHVIDQVDVTSDTRVGQWAESVISEHGPPDLLINNAAVINNSAPLWQIPNAEFDRTIDTNLKGTYYVLRHFLPEMVNQRRGIVVNFSSGWGRTTGAGVAPYCASKFAVEGLTASLAEELPEGMAAVALNPGIINTEMLRTNFGDSAAHFHKPEEWVRAAVPYLLSLGPDDSGKPLTIE
ncbi:3-oxoacyl-[acyl-carrier-protein] reductase FabG [Planctomycetes bacterium Pan216]|uniref:3-oxoacyl-[acyl-carrier-protein] reductase FabG n=1 Tax=Kolteria novifilia TaxID=2527975 RepID=A0A518B942_9BACT|nr:3-oxoacyl-[acyl-carrier-protein] reductase FabG [Planctomycetes bacterium Pan216]